jgi:hypothetical protein
LKKLSEYKGIEAIEILGDIIEPVNDIMADDELKELIQNTKGNTLPVIQYLLKFHAKEINHIMAILEGVPVDEYEPNFLSLPVMLMEILSDKDILSLFQSQGQTTDIEPSGSVTENTEGLKN